MGVNKTVTLITTGLLVFIAILVGLYEYVKKDYSREPSEEVEILRTWRLPAQLKEVSGIAFLDDERIACVQDEKGVIYIFNLRNSKIEKEINFEGKGDFEGIALNGSTAYVVESNGRIHEIRNFLDEEPQFEEYSTDLSGEENVEGLYFDRGKNRLLLALKSEDLHSDNYKGIYAFDLQRKELEEGPVVKLTFEGEGFENYEDKDVEERFFPSELNRDPKTGNLVLLDAEDPRLLFVNSSGKTIKLYNLNTTDFPQPEGISFDSQGEMFISNEGNPGTIHRVRINQ
ncbi:SdiA-regulated domain-containing protein [Salinimicrobium soli]|uniref:SdiA-regulated domain-containing protein n=1 Tax=Salinimicrobium soli TaxID=1254399 RepID=UPI003AAE98AF